MCNVYGRAGFIFLFAFFFIFIFFFLLWLLKVWHKINYEIFTSSLSYFALSPTSTLSTSLPKPFATEHNDIKSGLRLMSLPYAEGEDHSLPSFRIWRNLLFWPISSVTNIILFLIFHKFCSFQVNKICRWYFRIFL